MNRIIPPRRALGVLALGAVLTFALPPSPAVACTCAIAPTSAQYESASVVFAGLVVGVSGESTGEKVTFEVRSVYKGEPPAMADVETPATAEACGIQFIENASYLVFASKPDSTITTSLCSGTTDDLTLLDRAGYQSREVSVTEAAAAQRPAGATARLPFIAAAALAFSLVFAAHARRFARVMH